MKREKSDFSAIEFLFWRTIEAKKSEKNKETIGKQ